MNAVFAADKRARLIDIIRARSYRTGAFTLASGKRSNQYFNLKPTMMNPEGGRLAAEALLAAARPLSPDLLAGMEMGAVPLVAAAAALSHAAGAPMPTVFVRKQVKEHGSRERVEGLAENESVSGLSVVVVEDVTTTGGSALKAVAAIREAGGRVDHVLTLLDREDGAAQTLAAEGLTLHAVLTASDFQV